MLRLVLRNPVKDKIRCWDFSGLRLGFPPMRSWRSCASNAGRRLGFPLDGGIVGEPEEIRRQLPQGLKPASPLDLYGTTEVVPFPKSILEWLPAHGSARSTRSKARTFVRTSCGRARITIPITAWLRAG